MKPRLTISVCLVPKRPSICIKNLNKISKEPLSHPQTIQGPYKSRDQKPSVKPPTFLSGTSLLPAAASKRTSNYAHELPKLSYGKLLAMEMNCSPLDWMKHYKLSLYRKRVAERKEPIQFKRKIRCERDNNDCSEWMNLDVVHLLQLTKLKLVCIHHDSTCILS
ncbi:hypothetical protein H6P81_010269 [Aristolochia fimbriata]|uniref:Uncharacterized protein n=1 Tax=Aristolochia fimbriata TaxID=158543 RepID=A0AAV7ENW7_ARIFI|nr:hypothetical protein H6P81_010269 [Aristolochia fimbriata]